MRDAAVDVLAVFRSELRRRVTEEFDRSWPLLKHLLEMEFAAQISGERAQLRVALRDDATLHTARSLLVDHETFEAALQRSVSH